MKPVNTLILTLSFLALSGCAANPKSIEAIYVSPTVYESYDCEQIIEEMTRVSKRSEELLKQFQRQQNDEFAKATVGLVLLWPVIVSLEGREAPGTSEYAKLKGEYAALRQVLETKGCATDEVPPSPADLYHLEYEQKNDGSAPRPGSSKR